MSRADKFLREKLSMESEGESSTCSFGIDKTYRRISTSVPMESSGGKKKLSMETERKGEVQWKLLALRSRQFLMP
jgi:hypothetical protein